MNQEPSSITNVSVNQKYDLVIVGGGIVGTTLAVALKDTGLKIAIIETQTLTQAKSRKQAYALSILSSKILDGIGVWDDIFPYIGKFKYIRLSDAFSPLIVKFKTEDLKTDYLGYVGEHSYILSALQNSSLKSPDITWLENARVIGIDKKDSYDIVKVNYKQEEIVLETKLIVGADGAKSYIRQQANIKTRGWKYWQSCVAFTIKHSAKTNDTAFERFWETGPMGILPLPDNRCQIVWSAPHAIAKELQSLPVSEFISRLEHHTEGLLGTLELVSDRNLFPVQLMQSETYVKPRVALIGDAAHCCHPVGGQGLNLGIRDAAALAEVLTIASRQGKDIGDLMVLNHYNNWRKQENLAILGFTDFLDRLFSSNLLPVIAIRRLGLLMMRHIQPLKLFALKLMTGLKGRKPMAINN
ncbi:FAD-dependent hydroxylase [Geminocystis sp. NIES-3709]|uniref:FAD-dependent hydroxylase n=1 Tax=Geminocystis sp. NIES-3709 TaxID=1617448 RepID=UPI0005FC75FB|nr:FAD-dependent hydroxylase [Geminocystis sp. NIES-3709]BAQ65167.1 2-octaprenyl-6-methoxyphenol hydroxylase [Geminocystis sp. NIES-3709]